MNCTPPSCSLKPPADKKHYWKLDMVAHVFNPTTRISVSSRPAFLDSQDQRLCLREPKTKENSLATQRSVGVLYTPGLVLT